MQAAKTWVRSELGWALGKLHLEPVSAPLPYLSGVGPSGWQGCRGFWTPLGAKVGAGVPAGWQQEVSGAAGRAEGREQRMAPSLAGDGGGRGSRVCLVPLRKCCGFFSRFFCLASLVMYADVRC